MEISLEQVDKVRERTGVSYAEAKNALEINEGSVLDAIIYLEEMKCINEDSFKGTNSDKSVNYETIEEVKVWLKELINKGNVTRIKISKDGNVIIDVPVNAGIAAGVIAIIMPAILAFGLIAAVVTKITIEITKEDGSVEVVNKYVTKAVNDIKDVATDVASKVKDKVNEVKLDSKKTTYKPGKSDETVYTYTVNFDEEH